MQTGEFLRKVRERAGLKDVDEARRAADAVFGALRDRISHAGGDNVAAQLPRELRKLWESGLTEHLARSLAGVERMDLHEFLARVQNTGHLGSIGEAEVATRAVFTTLREQITPGAQRSIENQLPGDIRELWRVSLPAEMAPAEGLYGPERIGPAAAEVFRSDAEIAEEVNDLLRASDQLDAEKVDVRVRRGVVTLRGVVGSSGQWEAAGRIAREALGAKEVQNELAVMEGA